MDVRFRLLRRLRTKELMLLTVVLEKSLASPLDCKEIQPVHSKGDQSWVFIGRIDVEAETPILWSWSKVLVGSRRWTGRPGMLWFMGSERVGHNLVTELN